MFFLERRKFVFMSNGYPFQVLDCLDLVRLYSANVKFLTDCRGILVGMLNDFSQFAVLILSPLFCRTGLQGFIVVA